MTRRILFSLALILIALPALADQEAREVSDDGWAVAAPDIGAMDRVIVHRDEVPYGTAPDWSNTLRMQVGGLQVADVNGDYLPDVIVGCYHSNSYPPYEDWENLIYFNTGGALEADPSWISTDEVSTGDIQVALINDDSYPDVFAANGGGLSYPSVIYWGGPAGPSSSPGWYSNEPGGAWNNYAKCFDLDHDGDMDVVTANQGASEYDPSRPLYVFYNEAGVLSNTPGWASDEWTLSGGLDFADVDHNGWEDLAASKWVNYESCIYYNFGGALETTPGWTTGDDDSDKGVAFADVDGNGWADLALGHDPTQLWSNDAGAFAMSWTSGASYHGHSDIRFCDVDKDGDEDLAETHFSDGKVHIYLNRDGVLDTAPSWTYDSSSVGTAIAFGDIDGNGWDDLVVGNSGEPCVKVFFAQPTTDLVEAALRPRLAAAYPNPFNPKTTIRFELPEAAHCELAVFDTGGRRVATLFRGALEAGEQAFVWNGRDDSGRAMPSGVYLCSLAAGDFAESRKLVLAK